VGKSFFIKRALLAGAAVLVLGGAAVGVAAAQAQPNTPTQNRGEKYLEALANRLHVTTDQLKQAVASARQDVGLPNRPQQPNGAAPNPNGNARPGGPGLRGFPGRGPAVGAFLGKELDAVASLFKVTPDALRAELPGATLAELASKHGVGIQDVVNTIVKTANDQIDQAAQARSIPADRVSQAKQRISERVQEFVTTHRFPARGTGTRS
jgi:hypothetical protein